MSVDPDASGDLSDQADTSHLVSQRSGWHADCSKGSVNADGNPEPIARDATPVSQRKATQLARAYRDTTRRVAISLWVVAAALLCQSTRCEATSTTLVLVGFAVLVLAFLYRFTSNRRLTASTILWHLRDRRSSTDAYRGAHHDAQRR